jgi:uncharacterized protein YcfL
MKKILLVVLLTFTLVGCASLTYQTPEGTKVTYRRLLTGADMIKGQVGNATVEAKGQQQTLDADKINTLIKILGR